MHDQADIENLKAERCTSTRATKIIAQIASQSANQQMHVSGFEAARPQQGHWAIVVMVNWK